ncbi:MAG: NFACT family protein [Campylobacterota bacterium]|nr:NFACT family protein [Campylobacterota bacterium]
MKHSHLKQIIAYMQTFKRINTIHRVSNSIIKIEFSRDEILYFDMQRGNSSIFTCKTDIKRSKVFQAPFDVILAKKLNRSSIVGITMHNDDKIMRIEVSLSGSYKASSCILQLEFTGKYTNAIVIDEESVVIEALRHIDESVSTRSVKVGEILEEPPKPDFKPKEYALDDVKSYLLGVYSQDQASKLKILQKQKITLLHKRLSKLQKHYDRLQSEKTLQELADKYRHIGHLIVANLHNIRAYGLHVDLNDYNGSVIHVELPRPFATANSMKEYYFKLAKKTMQRALNLHIEKENLEGKIEYFKHFINTVETADTIESIKLLFPQKLKKSKEHRSDMVEIFFIEGYKVLLGKNERGNIELLQNAKARDIWIHLKDRPSAHVLIVTDKQNIPESVIMSAAEICVNFSVFEKGSYLVDYTPRREVKIQDGANVLYYNYSTLSVTKG